MEWSQLLNDILAALLPILVTAAIGALATWGKAQLARAKSYAPDVFDQVTYIAEQAVHAAEQAGAAKIVTNKKNYALNLAEKWLETKNIKVDLHLIDAAIEAAVWREINRDAEKPKSEIGFVKGGAQ